MNSLDKRLEGTFAAAGERLSRSSLLKRAAVVAGSVAGYGAVTQTALGAPSQCGASWGACGGQLCCGCYSGCTCQGSAFYCGNRPAGCSVQTAKWSRCCNSYWRYDWWDCGFFRDTGGCCGAGGSPSGSMDCSTCVNGCNAAYVNCYRCTFRIIVGGGC
jgi:hypothetical protein